MVMISPELRDKIERRAKRAWKRKREGDKSYKPHRISNVTDDELEYRVPYTPDYYGKEKVRVVKKDDGTIVVDPPTTGLIDLKKKDDVERIKKHAGEIRGYVRVKPKSKALSVGQVVTSQYQVKSREQIADEVKGDDRVFVVGSHANDVIEVKGAHILLNSLIVEDELDLEKDFGFTSGLLDCRSKTDVVRLRDGKHRGRVRAYKYTTKDAESPVQHPKLKYEPGKSYEIKDADTDPASRCHKGINVADIEWAKRHVYNHGRIFAFEFDVEDIAAVPTDTDGKFRVHRCLCVEEIDPKTLSPIKAAKTKQKTDEARQETKLLPAPKSPQDDLDDLTAPSDKEPTVPAPEETLGEGRPKKKKKGFFERLFGKKDDENES